MLIPGWVGLCAFYDPVGLSIELSCEAGSFSCCRLTLIGFYSQMFWGFLFLCCNPGLHGLSSSLVLPPSLSAHKCGTARPFALLVLQMPPCCVSSRPWLLISAPSSRLNECFFFNSLVVGLPYSSIFWQFWLFFVFQFVVVLLLVVQGGRVYLPMPPSWLEVLGF